MVEKETSEYYFNSTNINKNKNQNNNEKQGSVYSNYSLFNTNNKILYPSTSIKHSFNNNIFLNNTNNLSNNENVILSNIASTSNIYNDNQLKIHNEYNINNESTMIKVNSGLSFQNTPPKSLSKTNTSNNIDLNRKKSKIFTSLSKLNNNNNNISDNQILNSMNDFILTSIEDFMNLCINNIEFNIIIKDFSYKNLNTSDLLNPINDLIESIMMFKAFEFMNNYNNNFFKNEKSVFNLVYYNQTGKENMTDELKFGMERLKNLGKLNYFNLLEKYDSETFIDEEFQVYSLKGNNFTLVFVFNFLKDLLSLSEKYFSIRGKKHRKRSINSSVMLNNMFQTPNKKNKDVNLQDFKDEKDPHEKYKNKESNTFDNLSMFDDLSKFQKEIVNFLEFCSDFKIISMNLLTY